ncbi:MAG: hypothetical protein JSR86_04155 [Proteobacteria bacterium]|nr:hypothetical protein [Pseudomonadota bacterium]
MNTKVARIRRGTSVAFATALVFSAVLAAPSLALAQAAPDPSTDDQIQSLRMEARAARAELEDQRAEIAELRQEMRSQMAILRRAGLVDAAAPQNAQLATGDRPIIRIADQPAPPPPPAAAGAGGASAARPQSERQADQLLVDVGGVLLPRWTFQMEPSLTETHVSNPRVNIFGYTVFNAINIGTIRVDDISQDVLESALSFRMGLPHRTQIDVRVPYSEVFVRQTKGIGTGNIDELNTRGHHFGDVQATFSWQPFTEKGWRPAVVLRTRVSFPTGESVFEIPETYPPVQNGAETQLIRAPTGSGYYTVEPGFTLVWRSDPLVLFAGMAYANTFASKRYVVPLFNPNPGPNQPSVTSVDHGRIDTGNVYSFNVGLNFAVNERASLNFSYVDLFTKSSLVQATGSTAWTRIKGTATNDSRLGIGASYGLTDNIALVINAGMGLTDQSPAYTFGISLPITLPLRRR